MYFLWMLISAVCASPMRWTVFGGRSYAVVTTKLNFVTSMERCYDNSANLANFAPSYNFTKLKQRLRLGRDKRYWIAVGPIDTSFKSCDALYAQRRTWQLQRMNCSSYYPFICEKSASTTGIKPQLTSTSSHPWCTGGECRTKQYSVVMATSVPQHRLQPSFRSDRIPEASSTDPLPSHMVMYSQSPTLNTMSSEMTEVPPTIQSHATETPEAQLASKLLPSVPIPEHNTAGNVSKLFQLCQAYFKTDFHIKKVLDSSNLTMKSYLNESLVINIRATSRHRRKMTSADDQRTSSKAMGAAAVVAIATVLVCIVAMDVPRVWHEISMLTDDLYRRLK